jgi:cytochrome c peroxidase
MMAFRMPCGLIAACLALASSEARGQASFRLPSVVGLDEFLEIPDDNRLTSAKIDLGERLFFDPVLSRTRRISCASCHQPSLAFADSVQLSRGVDGRRGRRNAPAILNRPYGSTFFWDGRAESLEAQVLEPIRDPLEMDLALDELLLRLRASPRYLRAFTDAFADGLTEANVARALASYLRTLRSGDSPFDRSRTGDATALSAAAQRGRALFTGKAGCFICHFGPNLTDERFHNTGVAARTSDVGRYAVTRENDDRGAFKTPTLREVARTPPYMHDGSLPTLEAVVDFYDRGGHTNPGLDPEIRPLGLSEAEKQDLIAFLRALSGTLSAARH